LLLCYNLNDKGGDLVSTRVAKPDVHAEIETSRKSDSLNTNANNANFDDVSFEGAIAA